MNATREAWVVFVLLAGCGAPAEPRVGGEAARCPPCPEGTHCAADVMVKDSRTGKIVCYPTYCVAGPDSICEIDPLACANR